MKLSTLKFDAGFGYAAAVILAVSPLMRFSWDAGGQLVLHSAALVALFIILNYYKTNLEPSLHAALSVVLIVSAVSLLANPGKAVIRNNLFVLFDACVMAAAASLAGAEDKKKLLSCVLAAGLFLSVMALTKAALTYFVPGYDGSGFFELIVNSNALGGYLLLLLPVSFIFWKKGNNTGIAVSAVILLGVASTGSRAATVTAFAVIAVFASAYFEATTRKRFFLFLILVALVSTLFMYKAGFARSFSERLSWAGAALNMFINKPFTGLGWGSFADNYLNYRTLPGLSSLYAHNVFLQVAAETGIPGILSFLFLIYSFFKSASKRTTGESASSGLPLVLSAAGFLFYNLFDYSFFMPSIMCVFFFILGAGFDSHAERARPSAARTTIYCLVFAAAFYAITRLFAASVYFAKSDYYLKMKDYALAEQYSRKAIQKDVTDFRAYSKLAEASFMKYSQSKAAEDIDASIQAQLTAVKIFPPGASLYSDLAWLYVEKKDYMGALIAMKTAASLDKFNARYRRSLAEIEKRELDEDKK